METTEEYLKTETLKYIGKALENLASMQEHISQIDLDKIVDDSRWGDQLPAIHGYFKSLCEVLGKGSLFPLLLSIVSETASDSGSLD